MSKALPRERKKRDMNSGPLSEVTCWGMPCLEKRCVRKRISRSLEVHQVVVRIKIACLVSQLMIEIEFQGQSGIGSCLSGP